MHQSFKISKYNKKSSDLPTIPIKAQYSTAALMQHMVYMLMDAAKLDTTSPLGDILLPYASTLRLKILVSPKAAWRQSTWP